MNKGKLYLIPSFLADSNDQTNFPAINLEIVASLSSFIVENIRTTRRFLRKIGYKRDFAEVRFYELNKHTLSEDRESFLQDALAGQDMGLISEAGIPCIADPGSLIVSNAHESGIQVIPLAGPSSIFLALMASGFNGQSFQFHGYLPIDKKERDKKIRELENMAHRRKQTQIVMETPYRNNQLLEAILNNCQEGTLLCIASMISHDSLEYIKTKSIGSWKKQRPDLHKKPSVFLLY